tara:strand:+ start:13630 stop:14244 length:615 start_codon:yes stop_codon:yes gene_type:complete
MKLKEDISKLAPLFERVRSQLDLETAMDLDSIKDEGELSEPGYGRLHLFNKKITSLLNSEGKLYGIEFNDRITESLLFKLFVETYPDFSDGDLIKGMTPSEFIVGSEDSPLPFVGGSRQGELDGLYYDDIERVFGKPSLINAGSNDGGDKVQLEWDIKFDNGVRASIYDYKQYDIDPYNDVDFWSVGGNSPESAVEVYLAMGLI